MNNVKIDELKKNVLYTIVKMKHCMELKLKV
jgi:hypothetical protein